MELTYIQDYEQSSINTGRMHHQKIYSLKLEKRYHNVKSIDYMLNIK